jgi:hypothetical protein
MWGRSGSELFYLAPIGALMAVLLEDGDLLGRQPSEAL